MKIEFTDYMTGGPGYCGRVIIDITHDELSLSMPDSKYAVEHGVRVMPLTRPLPDQVVSVSDMDDACRAMVWANLSDDDRSSLGMEEARDISARYVKGFVMADGSRGAILVADGSPDYVNVIVDGRGCEFVNFEDVR